MVDYPYLSVVYLGQFNGKGGTFAQFTLYLNVAIVQVYYLLYVGQTQSEAFYIMDIAGVDTVELLENLLQVVLLDTDTGIADREVEVGVVIPRLEVNVQRLVRLAILDGVVHQVKEGVLEMHLIDIYCRVYSLYIGIDFSAGMLYPQGKRVGHILHYLVKV